MNKSLLNKIKNQLITEKELILIKQLQPIDIDVSGDDTDIVQSNILLNNHKQLMQRDKNKLKSIECALSKIEEGTYGICDECEEPINVERVKVNPICKLCIFCAEAVEKALKR